jgi:hypothetical protein
MLGNRNFLQAHFHLLNSVADPPGLAPGVKKVRRAPSAPPLHNVCLHRRKVGGRPEVNKSEMRLFSQPKKESLYLCGVYA